MHLNAFAMHLTASKLYDYIQCPHKPWRGIYGPQDEKIQEFLYLSGKKDLIINSSFNSIKALIVEICELNYSRNKSHINYSAVKFAKDFDRKMTFWLTGAAVWG